MKKILTSLILVLLFIPIMVFAQDKGPGKEDGNTGIVYGDNHVFSVSAPEGWVLDTEALAGRGVHAVFYEKGFTFQDAPSIIYANVVQLDSVHNKDLEGVIQGDIDKFKKDSPEIIIKDGKPIETSEGKNKAVIRSFFDESYGTWEAVGYIPEEEIVVIIVLNAISMKEYEKSLDAFKSVVESYLFLGVELKMNTN